MAKLIDKTVKMNLVGLDGNAFSLIGAFSGEARRQGWTQQEIGTVTKACMAGDYDNLLCVLSTHTESLPDEDDYEDEYDDYEDEQEEE